MSTDVELKLIERVRAQDPSALEILMEQYGPRLYRVAFGITRSHGDAEEVVQDVFLTLFRKIDSFEGRAALGTLSKRTDRLLAAPGSIASPPTPR